MVHRESLTEPATADDITQLFSSAEALLILNERTLTHGAAELIPVMGLKRLCLSRLHDLKGATHGLVIHRETAQPEFGDTAYVAERFKIDHAPGPHASLERNETTWK